MLFSGLDRAEIRIQRMARLVRRLFGTSIGTC